jgi:hypothetical protein
MSESRKPTGKEKKIGEVIDKLDGKQPKKPQFDPAESKYTLSQLQDLQNFFFRLSGSKVAKWLAVCAALGATLGGVHIVWLAIRYMFRF